MEKAGMNHNVVYEDGGLGFYMDKEMFAQTQCRMNIVGNNVIDSRCGLHCTGCEYKEACGCGGCIETNGHPFHGECPIAICCQNKGFVHCGECPDIPCEQLYAYSYLDKEHGDNPPGARVEQCKRWYVESKHRMPKRLITIVGANGVGKTTTSEVLLQLCEHSAYVDADWCRAINPFPFTEATKKTVTDNIFCLFRNYLLCDDIETVIFPYGFHGERKAIYDEVIRRLREEAINFEEHIVILKCEYEENKRRSIKDNRDSERVERGMRNTFFFYDEFEYPEIDTTFLSPEQVAEKIMEMFYR